MHLGIRRHALAESDAVARAASDPRVHSRGTIPDAPASPAPATARRGPGPPLCTTDRAVTQAFASPASSRSVMRSGYDSPEAIQQVGNIEIGVNPGIVLTSFT